MTRSIYIAVITFIAALQTPAQEAYPQIKILPFRSCDSIANAEQNSELKSVREEVQKLVTELPRGRDRDLALDLLREISGGMQDGLCMAFKDGEFMARIVGNSEIGDKDPEITLGDRSSPEIKVDVTELPEEAGFGYVYLVSNKDQARDAITTWGVMTPKDDQALRMDHPLWEVVLSHVPASGHMAVKELPDAEARKMPNIGSGTDFSRWRAPTEQLTIGPGSSQFPFTLKSRFLPGWTTAYVGSEETVKLPQSPISPKAQTALNELATPENFYSNVVTIGPKFAPETDRSWIAGDWHLGIQMMTSADQLEAGSPYVVSLLQSLALIAASASKAQVDLKVNEEPKEGLEAVLDKAVRMALR